jgi:hypothetical protein
MATALASADRLRAQVADERERLSEQLDEATQAKAEEAHGKRAGTRLHPSLAVVHGPRRGALFIVPP